MMVTLSTVVSSIDDVGRTFIKNKGIRSLVFTNGVNITHFFKS